MSLVPFIPEVSKLNFKFITWNLTRAPKPSPIWFLYLLHQSGVSHFLPTKFQWILRVVPIFSDMSAIFETHGSPLAFHFPSYNFLFLLNCFTSVSSFGFLWEGFFLLATSILLHLDFRSFHTHRQIKLHGTCLPSLLQPLLFLFELTILTINTHTHLFGHCF